MTLWVMLLLSALAQDVVFSAPQTTPHSQSTTDLGMTSATISGTHPSVSNASQNETGSTASEVPPSRTSTPPLQTHFSSPSTSGATHPTGDVSQESPTTMEPGSVTARSSSKEPLTSQEVVSHSLSTAVSSPQEGKVPLSQQPGLVVVICIFVVVLLVGAAVVLVKCYRGREPAFKRLDEVPMQGKVTEDSPFARYPPK